MRVLLSQDGTLSVTAAPLQRLCVAQDLLIPSKDPSAIRTIYLDPEPTLSSVFTHTKTTFRPHYNAARARVGLSAAPTPSDSHIDVLLHTPEGLVTETSIGNLAFNRNGTWLTPRASTGCLPGVVRRYLIEQGRWVEAQDGELRIEDMQEGELVMTANGVEGCCMGRIVRYDSKGVSRCVVQMLVFHFVLSVPQGDHECSNRTGTVTAMYITEAVISYIPGGIIGVLKMVQDMDTMIPPVSVHSGLRELEQ